MIRIADSHSDYMAYLVLNNEKESLYDHADLPRMTKGGG